MNRAAKTQAAERVLKTSPSAGIRLNAPAPIPAYPILRLQKTIGNHAVQHLLRSRAMQAKLAISQPGDLYEQEADRVAERVMRMPDRGFKPGELQSGAMMQRRVAEQEISNSNGLIIQRAAAADDLVASAETKPKEPTEEEGSRCPSWFKDPQSLSKRAAETYAQNDMTPPSTATVEKIDCEGPNWLGNWGCYVYFSDGLVLRVIVRAKDVVVGVPPINTWTPPPATPLCFYDYHCPEGLLVLTKRECKSATPSGPPVVAKRPLRSPAIQAKLAISQPGDIHEQEADRVADQVIRMPEPALQRACSACASRGSPCPECATNEKALLQRNIEQSPHSVGSVPDDFIRNLGPGEPLDAATRAYFEPRFGYDFSSVRVHTGTNAAASAQSVGALAYTVGNDVVFSQGSGTVNAGNRLLAHELTHVVQQTSRAAKNGITERHGTATPLIKIPEATISRAAIYPDSSCASATTSITRAWPTAKKWVELAIRRLNDSGDVSGALQAHFKIDPNHTAHAADLSFVKQNFSRMRELFDTDIDNRCTPASADGQCTLPDGRNYAAFVHAGQPEDGITHCLKSADVGFFSGAFLIETLVHEVAHLADPASTDFAFRHSAAVTTYARMTRSQAIHNGDSYSEFAKELFMGTATEPLVLGLSTGALLSSGRPRWAIGASFSHRSRSGIEVFDLVGGLHTFIALDVGAPAEQPVRREFGMELNIGAISRSAQTHLFVDTRIGGFVTTDLALEEPTRAGLSSSTVIGWANSGFRTGLNLRLMYDILQKNHAVIIGGEFNWGP
jgi:hypothetical protein